MRVRARVHPTVSQSVMKMPLRLYSPGTGMLNWLMAAVSDKIKSVAPVAGLFPLNLDTARRPLRHLL